MGLQDLFQPILQQIDSTPVRQAFEYLLAELDQQRAMQHQFALLGQRMDALEARVQSLEERVWAAIHELAEAQRRTEQRVEELAEAQKRTEARLDRLEAVVAELAEAQRRTEQRVEELAEAQKRTEARLDRLEAIVAKLAEAQRRTEQRVEELAEAQKRTEMELRQLAGHVQMLHERVEGLSNAVGYSLENRAYLALPRLLSERYGIQVEGDLWRRYVTVGLKTRQVNIYGYGYRNGQRVLIVGEAKVRPSRREVERFRKLCDQLEAQEGLPVVALFVAHDFPPEIERALREQNILPIWSYEIERVLYERAPF